MRVKSRLRLRGGMIAALLGLGAVAGLLLVSIAQLANTPAHPSPQGSASMAPSPTVSPTALSTPTPSATLSSFVGQTDTSVLPTLPPRTGDMRTVTSKGGQGPGTTAEFSVNGAWTLAYLVNCGSSGQSVRITMYDAAVDQVSTADPPITVSDGAGTNQESGGQFEIQIATKSCTWEVAAYQ